MPLFPSAEDDDGGVGGDLIVESGGLVHLDHRIDARVISDVCTEMRSVGGAHPPVGANEAQLAAWFELLETRLEEPDVDVAPTRHGRPFRAVAGKEIGRKVVVPDVRRVPDYVV